MYDKLTPTLKPGSSSVSSANAGYVSHTHACFIPPGMLLVAVPVPRKLLLGTECLQYLPILLCGKLHAVAQLAEVVSIPDGFIGIFH
jgi:hypothetical protein